MLVDSDHRSWVSERNLMTTHFLLETWRSLRESNSAMHGFKIQRTKITRGLATSRKQNGALGACTWAAPKAKKRYEKRGLLLVEKQRSSDARSDWKSDSLSLTSPVSDFQIRELWTQVGLSGFNPEQKSKCLKVVNLDYFIAEKQSNLIQIWLEIRFPVAHFGP